IEKQTEARIELRCFLDADLSKRPAQLRCQLALFGQVEELTRTLGQLSMDAATQRFVAEDQARIERYNRLEDGAYQVLAQHLAEVLAAQQQAERESFAAALGSTERGHVEQGRRLAAEAEFLMRDVQNVAVDEQRILNALAVDERAVGAAQVLN